MACFVVPAAEAVIVTAAALIIKKKEQKLAAPKLEGASISDIQAEQEAKKPSVSKKLGWLARLLWGGVVLLAFEHLWHREITLYPPFLTAMSSPTAIREMLSEMATVGTAMSCVVTAAWGMLCAFADLKFKKLKGAEKPVSSAQKQ